MRRFLVNAPGLAPFLVWAETPEAALALAGDWLGLPPESVASFTATPYPEHP